MRRKITGQPQAAGVHVDGYPNPLLRASDITQARVKRWITALLIATIPLVAWIGTATYSDQQQRYELQQTDVHQTTATTTSPVQASPLVQTDFSSTAATTAATVDGRWTHLGVAHTGRITVNGDAPVGTAVQIWVDNDGEQTTRPLSSADVVTSAIFTSVGGGVALGTLLLGIYFATRLRLDARRDEEWESEINQYLRENTLP